MHTRIGHESKHDTRTLEALISSVSASAPGCWQEIEGRVLAHHGAGDDHDEFLPLGDFVTIAGELVGGGNHRRLSWAHAAAILAPWRYTRRIYRIDEDLRDTLLDTPVVGDLPIELFGHLPDYSVCIDLGNLPASDDPSVALTHLWVTRTWPPGQSHPSLALLALEDAMVTRVVAIPLVEGLSLEDALLAASSAGSDRTGRDPARVVRDESAWIRKVMPLVLLTCSSEPDVVDIRRDTRFARIRTLPPRGKRRSTTLWVPPRDRDVPIGRAQGDVIRRVRSHVGASVGRSVSAHVRAGHWHMYWTGPMSGLRVPVLRWLSPTIVGANTSTEIATAPQRRTGQSDR